MQRLVVARREKIPVARLSQTIHAHPTLAEADRRAADQSSGEKLFTSVLGRLLRIWVRWVTESEGQR
jgi:hypothetical protein